MHTHGHTHTQLSHKTQGNHDGDAAAAEKALVTHKDKRENIICGEMFFFLLSLSLAAYSPLSLRCLGMTEPREKRTRREREREGGRERERESAAPKGGGGERESPSFLVERCSTRVVCDCASHKEIFLRKNTMVFFSLLFFNALWAFIHVS